MQVNLRAAFSRYAITPARGISFGPVMYNTSSKPRSFDVTNMGDFPITLKVFNLALGLVSHMPWNADRVFGKAFGKVLSLLKRASPKSNAGHVVDVIQIFVESTA